MRENGTCPNSSTSAPSESAPESAESVVEKCESAVDLSNQFHQSLPLPSENPLRTPTTRRRVNPRRNLRVRQEYDFMKYLDHAAEGTGNVFKNDYTSVFETEASTPRSRQEPVFRSDSGMDYLELRADFERAILHSRQAFAMLDPHNSGGPSSALDDNPEDDDNYRRPILEYDDRQITFGINPDTDMRVSGTTAVLSRSFADSPFFLKKSTVDISKDPSVSARESPSDTPSRLQKLQANTVTPPNPDLHRALPIDARELVDTTPGNSKSLLGNTESQIHGIVDSKDEDSLV